MSNHRLFLGVCLGLLALMGGCASTSKPTDTELEFRKAKPLSILVLPPLNLSVDIRASQSVYAHVTQPLSEAGYYVFPVALVDEMFKENGYASADLVHTIPPAKLHDIFKADAVLYIRVIEYGTQYTVIASQSLTKIEAELVDLRTGIRLWTGKASASSEEGENNSNQGGLAGLLISAVVKQIVGTLSNQDDKVAKVATDRLLTAGDKGGMLYGPRNPRFHSEPK